MNEKHTERTRFGFSEHFRVFSYMDESVSHTHIYSSVKHVIDIFSTYFLTYGRSIQKWTVTPNWSFALRIISIDFLFNPTFAAHTVFF